MKPCRSQWLKSLPLEGITYSLCKTQVPFQWCFICSSRMSKASHCLFYSPGNQILTVLTQPCLLRSLLCTHSTKLSPLTSPCPDGPCPRDGMLPCSRDLIHCGFVYNCCRRNCIFCLVQIQGLEVHSRQTRGIVNDAFLPHPSSVLPPRVWGANSVYSCPGVSPSSA